MTFKRVLTLVLVCELAVFLLAWVNYGFTIQALQAVARYSGRFSLGIFGLIFLFHNNERINVRTVLSENFFLVFAIVHGIHLVDLATYVYFSDSHLIPIRLAGGGLAYAMIFVMPLIVLMERAGKISSMILSKAELIYLFYVWFIFFMTYLSRVQGKLPGAGGTYTEHVVLLGWVCMLLGIRLSRLLMKTFR